MITIYILLSVCIVSLLSLVGIILLMLRTNIFSSAIHYTVALSCGILLGSAFFDLLPEATESIGNDAFTYIAVGFVVFFVIEKLLAWHHCAHEDDHHIHPVGYLNLIGDGIHNFLDGAIIAIAFLTSIPLGITTTLAVIAHELPHEFADFSILMHSGFSAKRALFFNLLSAATAILGGVSVLVFSSPLEHISGPLIAFAAGNFLYIAASDLIPSLHTDSNLKKNLFQSVLLIVGIYAMWIVVHSFAE